jgi:hypothetical protein
MPQTEAAIIGLVARLLVVFFLVIRRREIAKFI